MRLAADLSGTGTLVDRQCFSTTRGREAYC